MKKIATPSQFLKDLHLKHVSNRDAVFKDTLLYPWAQIEPDLEHQLQPLEIAKKLESSDVRSWIFQAKELGFFNKVLFEKRGLESEFVQIAAGIKEFEDALGHLVDANGLPEKLIKLGVSDSTVAWAKVRGAGASDHLLKMLKTRGWLGEDSRALRSLVDFYCGSIAPKQQEYADYLEEQILDHTTKIREMVSNRGPVTFENTEKGARYPDGKLKVSLQGYSHWIKRRLRKLSLLKLALRGKIRTIDFDHIPESLAAYQQVPEGLRKFMKPRTSPFAIKHHVFFNRAAENALAIFIERFNAIKDNGEFEGQALEATIASGEYSDRTIAKAELRVKIGKSNPKWVPWEEEIETALKNFEKSELLDRLIVRRKDLQPASLDQFEKLDNQS